MTSLTKKISMDLYENFEFKKRKQIFIFLKRLIYQYCYKCGFTIGKNIRFNKLFSQKEYFKDYKISCKAINL